MSLSIVDAQGKPFENPVISEESQLNAGKTKIIFPHRDNVLAIVHRNIITANNTPIYTGNALEKGTASAYSTALLFRRIEAMGIPTSHVGIYNSNTTLDESLDMLPFEIIWRRYNVEGNSWMKRNPDSTYNVGERYDEIIYEACLKWSVKTSDGEEVHDPFLVLDENFQPQLRPDGMPRLMHSNNNTELNYTQVIHPNKGHVMTLNQVQEAIANFSKHADFIRQMTETIQQVTFDTYAEIGRLNADGKIELGVDTNGKLRLGDELELDSLRNISPKSVIIHNDCIQNFETDTLGTSLNTCIDGGAVNIHRIFDSRHSGKQVYRKGMEIVSSAIATMEQAFGSSDDITNVRRGMNDVMAKFTTSSIYIPVALALSQRFGSEVGYLLEQR